MNYKLSNIVSCLKDMPWNWSLLTSNKIIYTKKYKFENENDNYYYTNERFNLKWDVIESIQHDDTRWSDLSCHVGISWDFVIKNPKIKWHWPSLSINKAITWDIIKNNIDTLPSGEKAEWNWSNVSMNPNIHIHDILSNPELPWDWECVSMNPNITLDFILENPELKWNWHYISHNPSISIRNIMKKMDDALVNKNWDWYKLTSKEDVTWEFVKKIPKHIISINWYNLTISNNIPLSTILNNIHLPWNMLYLTLDKKVNFEDIKNNPHIDWKYDVISYNPNITFSNIIDDELKIDWCWKEISSHHNITWDIIRSNPDKPWDWEEVSRNRNITWDIIVNNPDLKHIFRGNARWYWDEISRNPNITCDIIRNNLDLRPIFGYNTYWNWDKLSENPNITLSFIKENINQRWNWVLITTINRMVDTHGYFHSNLYKKKMTKILHDTIQEELIKVSCHPKRVLYWNEDVNDPGNPYYGLTQEDINKIYT